MPLPNNQTDDLELLSDEELLNQLSDEELKQFASENAPAKPSLTELLGADPGSVAGRGHSFIGGISKLVPYNMGDEAVASLSAVANYARGNAPSFSDAYDQGLEQARQYGDAFSQMHPTLGAISSLIGMVDAPLPGLNAETALGRTVQGALGAGTVGAAYGAGAGTTPEERLSLAGQGGGMGLLLGGGLGALSSAAPAIGRKLFGGGEKVTEALPSIEETVLTPKMIRKLEDANFSRPLEEPRAVQSLTRARELVPELNIAKKPGEWLQHVLDQNKALREEFEQNVRPFATKKEIMADLPLHEKDIGALEDIQAALQDAKLAAAVHKAPKTGFLGNLFSGVKSKDIAQAALRAKLSGGGSLVRDALLSAAKSPSVRLGVGRAASSLRDLTGNILPSEQSLLRRLLVPEPRRSDLLRLLPALVPTDVRQEPEEYRQ